jgi:hypothetical protein
METHDSPGKIWNMLGFSIAMIVYWRVKKNNQVPVDAFTDGNNFQQSKIRCWRAKGPIGVGFKNKRGNMDEL